MDAVRRCFSVLAVAAICFCLAGTAAAQGDALGIWFDEGYTQSSVGVESFPTTLPAYLVLHDPSVVGVGGWECRVEATGPAVLLDWRYEGLSVNFQTPPQFVVGLGAPLPHGEAVLLATVDCMVHDFGPVTFSLTPVQFPSVPDAMSYISFDDKDTLLPLGTVTGLAQVAWINRDMPVCTVSTDTLNFHDRGLGSSITGEVVVTNDGGGDLVLDVRLEPGCEGFSILSGGGARALRPGHSVTVQVAFVPTALTDYACELLLGMDCPTVSLLGSGREPILAGDVSPRTVDFGEVVETVYAGRYLNIFNTGELPLEVALEFGAGCEAFGVEGDSVFTIPAGVTRTVILLFHPPEPGQYACTLDLGPVLGTVDLSGVGIASYFEVVVQPDSIGFGEIVLGETVQRNFYVTNNGDAPVVLDVALEAGGPPFTVAGAPYQAVLMPGSTQTVSVFFEPPALGDFADRVLLGDRIDPVPVTGSGGDPAPDCTVTGLVAFGEVAIFGSASRVFTVYNTGNTTIELQPSIDCDVFTLGSYPATITPGSGASVRVYFRPTAATTYSCLLDLGDNVCGDVTLTGEGRTVVVPGDFNLVGVSLHPTVYDNEGIVQPFTIFDSYLILFNPETTAGVWAWELQVTTSEEILFLGASLAGDQVINFLNPPEFLVGLASPLPHGEMIVLASMQMLTLAGTPQWIGLQPLTSTPSIPGRMAWGTNANYDLAPMDPVTGEEIAAIIYSDGPTATLTSAPVAVLADGRVSLEWPVPSDGIEDGCHLYRRHGDGHPVRLTNAPLTTSGSRYGYVDDAADLAGGGTVAYSYSLVREGVEFAFSPETELALPVAAPLLTRLLPNVPNPFNPETEIRWEMKADGPCRITIYDVTGRRVRVLADGHRAAGPHAEIWRGRDDGGRRLPSGAYYARLETATSADTRKMMLLK